MSDSKKPASEQVKSGEETAVPAKNTEVKLKRSREGSDDDPNAEEVGEKRDEEVTQKKPKTAKSEEVGEVEEKATAEASDKTDVSDKPKHIFGSATSFGSGFAAAKGSAATSGSKSSKDKESSFKPSAFGSGLAFGGGFTMLKKTDEKDSKATEKDQTPEPSKEKEETPFSEDSKEQHTEAESTIGSTETTGFKLQKQEVNSGEELEEVVYQVNAKLYQLEDLKLGWKERGVGFIKVNKNKSTEKARLVMRSRGVLKVILNLPLIKGFKIQKGFPGSLQGEKFIRITAVDDNKAPLQYAVKTGKEETVQELYENIVKLVPE